MSKYMDSEVSGFLLNSGYPLKQIKRVVKVLLKDHQERMDELDAEYEMGRAEMPEGYMKRRNK